MCKILVRIIIMFNKAHYICTQVAYVYASIRQKILSLICYNLIMVYFLIKELVKIEDVLTEEKTAQERRKFMDVLEISQESMSAKYLGLPVYLGKSKVALFAYLKEKV